MEKRSYQKSLKKGLRGNLTNRGADAKKFNKDENNWKGELKYLKKKNNIVYRMAKRTGPHWDLKKTKKI